MLLRKTPLSKKLTSEEIEAKLKEVVRFREPESCLLCVISPTLDITYVLLLTRKG